MKKEIYTQLVKDSIYHYFALYGQKPDNIVLGSYVANEITKEAGNLSIANEMIGSNYYFYDPRSLETFEGVPVSISYEKPFLVRMVYHIDAYLPDGADENTELVFKPENKSENKPENNFREGWHVL